MNRYKPVGWKSESYRHSLASKGIKTSFSAIASRGGPNYSSSYPSLHTSASSPVGNVVLDAMKQSKCDIEKPVGVDPINKSVMDSWEDWFWSLKHRNINKLSPSDKIKGGLGDNLPDSRFADSDLAEGITVEMEHTNDPDLAKEIAKDHLAERSDYYKRLRMVEQKW